MAFDDDIVEECRALSHSQASGIRLRILDMITSQPDCSLLQAMDDRSLRPRSPGHALMEYVRALFLALAPSARRNDAFRPASLLLKISVKLLELVHEGRASADTNIVGCLDLVLQDIDAIPPKSLPSLVEVILDQLAHTNTRRSPNDGITLRLLPRCLSILYSCFHPLEVRAPDGSLTCISGADYVHRCIKSMLASSPWSKPVLTEIMSILRDMPLSEVYCVDFVSAILVQMKHVEPVDLPAYVYQLLLLASKYSKRIILLGVLSFFSLFPNFPSHPIQEASHNLSTDSFRQIEGTIILHINFAVKQNPSLGQEILFIVRGHHLPLSSFFISVVLSIARIQRFEEAALNLLRGAVAKSFHDFKLSKNSLCASGDSKGECAEDVQSLEQSFLQTVQSTALGWDHIIPSLVRFGFMLTETTTSKDSSSDPFVMIRQDRDCCDLGVVILQAAFDVHEMARDEIIEQSKCAIIGLKPEQSFPIIRMVGQLVQKYPHLMVKHITRLKECLDYYTFLHPISASSLIYSICPLFHLSPDLQGFTVLVLRKAMFGREVLQRLTALQGLFNLLVSDRASQVHSDSDSLMNVSSEASCSQQGYGHARKTPNLFQDLKGLLCRCLLQQAKIREVLYSGLLKLVLADPIIVDNVLNMLWPHFCRYYKTDEDPCSSLDVGCCVRVQDNNAVVEEPLDRLIFLVHNLLILQPQEQDGNQPNTETCFEFSLSQDNEASQTSANSSFRDAFVYLRKAFQNRSNLELNIDKAQDSGPDTMSGKIHIEKVQLYLGIYEVLIDAVINQVTKCEDDLDEAAEAELQSYVSIYDALEQILLKHGNCHNSKSWPPVNSNISGKQLSGVAQILHRKAPFLSITSATYLLQHVQKFHVNESNNDANISTSSNADSHGNLICHKYKLVYLAAQVCLRHLKFAASDTCDQEITGGWKMLGKPILDALAATITIPTGIFSSSTDKKEREKQGRGRKSADETRDGLILILVRCLEELIKLVLKRNCLMECLRFILPATNEERRAESSCLHENLHKLLLEKIQPILEHLLNQSQFREFEILAGVLLSLGRILEPSEMRVHGLWAQSLSKSSNFTNNGVAKALIRLSVCLQPPPDDLLLCQVLSEELLKVMGTDEDEGIEVSGLYHMINTSTKNCVAGFLLQHVEMCLTDAEWFISKLKLHPKINTSALPQELFVESRKEISRLKSETALHTRLEALVIILSSFVQMSACGAVAENFLKVTTKLYRCLALATKLTIAPKGFKQAPPSTKFQLLTEMTCTRLTAPLYNFMAVMQREQQENCQGKGSVNKIKREVKTIPNLVFYIEDYERYLIQLSKLTKVNLLRHAKRSTARDFKILDNGKRSKQVEEADANAEVETAADSESDTPGENARDSNEEQSGSEDVNGSQTAEDEDERPAIVGKYRWPMEKRAIKSNSVGAVLMH